MSEPFEDIRYAVLARKLLASGRARSLRQLLGLSQRQLGAVIGVSAVCVSSWECGHSRPQQHHAVALGRELAQMDEIYNTVEAEADRVLSDAS